MKIPYIRWSGPVESPLSEEQEQLMVESLREAHKKYLEKKKVMEDEQLLLEQKTKTKDLL